MPDSFSPAAAPPGEAEPLGDRESNPDLLTASYDYTLPPDRIAQTPVEPRDQARMLVVYPDRHEHRRFCHLPDYLREGDLLVLNDTKVIPARLFGAKEPSGARVEVLLLEPCLEGIPAAAQPLPDQAWSWRVLVRPGKRVKVGDRIGFWSKQGSPSGLRATVLDLDPETGGRVVQFEWEGAQPFEEILEQVGRIPLPPYIRLPDRFALKTTKPSGPSTPARWLLPRRGCTLPELLERLAQKGIQTAYITLNIGLGTFRPVEAEQVTEHRLHSEWLKVPAETVAAIQKAQARGGRVIAVGTTVVRSLETAAASGTLQPWQGKSDLFIYPGYSWRVIQGLVTNFHLPRSSLMMLVAALIGRQRLLDLYREAVDQGYRFYSFGDGMLILP
jgi:S-adenosylmethionine--tRNA ribosyltransferase-isomerase